MLAAPVLGPPHAYALVESLLGLLQAYIGGSPAMLGLPPVGVPQSYVGVLAGISLLRIAVQCNLGAFNDENDSASPAGPEVDSDESTAADASADDPDSRGIIYTRVSSRGQVVDGTSLDEQIRNLTAIAGERGISVVRQFQDAGETGRNFDREGIRQVRRVAMKESVEYVLVDDVDRIGRHAAETIFYLYELRKECEVTVITTEEGELDIKTINGLLHIIMRSLSSQLVNDTRARRAHNACVEKFREKNWSVFHNEAPLGYTLTDADWLEIDESEVPVVQDLFETFLEVDIEGAYSTTADQVGWFDDDASSDAVKGPLANPVYIGEPTIATTSTDADDDQSETTVEDAELQIIDEETFEQAQEKIQCIHERYSTDSEEADDIKDLVEEFGLRAVVDSSPEVRLHCPEPDCDAEMVKNGQRTLINRRVHNYKCTKCGRQGQFPTENGLERLQESGEDT